MPKKKLESAHKIISLNVLATGTLLLTTENRVYEHKDGKWTPMLFADDPVEPETEKPAPVLASETDATVSPTPKTGPTTWPLASAEPAI
jgi:hypothetical protein